jgi:hypothetical protein
MILKAGFKSGVDALPPEVKDEIDKLFGLKYPPKEILRQTAQKYPGVSLPSKSALYNYRNKYFEPSLVKSNGVTKEQEVFDTEKIKVKSLILTTIKQFIATDLPKLRELWSQDPANARLARTYMEGVKLTLDGIGKFNIQYQLKEETEMTFGEMVDSAEQELGKEGLDEQLARIFTDRKSKLLIRASKKVSVAKTGM